MRSLALVAVLTGCIGPQLDVMFDGDGAGVVVVDDGVESFKCSDTCGLIANDPILLTPTAQPGSTFIGWSGGCSGLEPCLVKPSADVAITARFDLTRFALSVSLEGTGAGTVSSADEGIRCGTDCTHSYAEGSGILLTATPTSDAKFTGWSGGCSGTSPMCLVTLAETQQVTASFTARNPQTLTVTHSGTGTGRVISAPLGIACGETCTEQVDPGTIVTLAAFADPGSMFTGWSGGGCSGTGSCTATLAASETIDAAFAAVPYALTVVPSGTGSGTVLSAPAGINCGVDCTEAYLFNTEVVLTAAAASGSTFMGWSGGVCSGTGTCSVTVDQARTVGAVFKSLTDPFIVSSVTSMTTDTAGGVYTTWIGAWANVTTNKSGDELGILLPFDEPNTSVVETQYWYQRSPSPTPSVLAIGPSNGGSIPAQILTVVANTGTIHVYMPSMVTNDCVRTRFYVAADGSTYHSRADHDYTYSAAKANIPTEQCYSTWGVVGPDLTPAQAMVPQHLARAAP